MGKGKRETFEQVRKDIGEIAEAVVDSTISEDINKGLRDKRASVKARDGNVAHSAFILWDMILDYAVEQARLFNDKKTREKSEFTKNDMLGNVPKLAHNVVQIFAKLIETKEKDKQDQTREALLALIAKDVDPDRPSRLKELDELLNEDKIN